MSSFHNSDIPMIETQREWEKTEDRRVGQRDSAKFRNLMIAGLFGIIACVFVVMLLRG